jgi:hypothetical protein
MTIFEFLKNAAEALRSLAKEKGYSNEQILASSNQFLHQQAQKLGLTLDPKDIAMFEQLFLGAANNVSPSNISSQENRNDNKLKVFNKNTNASKQSAAVPMSEESEDPSISIRRAISLAWAQKSADASSGSFGTYVAKLARAKK